VSWGFAHTLRVWDLATGLCSWTLEGHQSGVHGALLLPDGSLLSWTTSVLKVWDPTAGICWRTLEADEDDVITGSLLLPDGAVLSSHSSGTMRIWDLAAGLPKRTLVGHKTYVECPQLLPDGDLLSWSWDGTLRVWPGVWTSTELSTTLPETVHPRRTLGVPRADLTWLSGHVAAIDAEAAR